MAKPQFSTRTLLVAVAVVAVLMAVAIEINGRIEDLAANGYRVQEAGDLLVDYLDECGTWPENWGDLERYVEANKSTFRYVPNIEDLRTHVRIKFQFDPDEVDLQSGWSDQKPQFVVVISRYGRTAGATRNPNEFIYAYLKGNLTHSMLKANKQLKRNLGLEVDTEQPDQRTLHKSL